MPWSSVTGGLRDLIQMVLIPLGGLVIAIALVVDLLAHGRQPDAWLAGISLAMMGLPTARILDLRRGDGVSREPTLPPSSSPSERP